jgi:hypothetical protein
MILSPGTLIVDVKCQDQYRNYISSMLADPTLVPTAVILGDSDLDYSLAPNISNSRILNAPYSTAGVKHKLIFNGVGKNLSGVIKTFARKVDADGTIESLYNYPTTINFTPGVIPPLLNNGNDWNQITFLDSQMGYILFFETVLDYYLTSTGVKEQLKESYTFTFSWNGSSVTPNGWEYVIDNTNGSLLLSKIDTTSTPIGLNYRGSITVVGKFTQKIKVITFNY